MKNQQGLQFHGIAKHRVKFIHRVNAITAYSSDSEELARNCVNHSFMLNVTSSERVSS